MWANLDMRILQRLALNYMKKTNNNKNNETKKKILAKTALLISLLVNHDHQRQQSFIPLYMPYICAT